MAETMTEATNSKKYAQFLGRLPPSPFAMQPGNPEEPPASQSVASMARAEEIQEIQETVNPNEPEAVVVEPSESTQKTGWLSPGHYVKYIVAGVGFSKIDLENKAFDRAIGDQYSTTSSVDTANVGWKLAGGVRLNPYFGVEAGYVNLGEVKYEVASTNTAENVLIPAVLAAAPLSLSGAVVEGVGFVPLTSRCSLLGKGGAFFWNGRTEVSSAAGQQTTRKDSGTGLALGLGGQCQVSENNGFRLEWERFFVDDGVDLITAGMEVVF